MSASVVVFVVLSTAVSSEWARTSRHCFRGAYRGKRKGGAAVVRDHVILIRNRPYMEVHKKTSLVLLYVYTYRSAHEPLDINMIYELYNYSKLSYSLLYSIIIIIPVSKVMRIELV